MQELTEDHELFLKLLKEGELFFGQIRRGLEGKLQKYTAEKLALKLRDDGYISFNKWFRAKDIKENDPLFFEAIYCELTGKYKSTA